MPVWVQHRQNTSWEPATIMSQCTSNSYWIMQENGTDQPKCIGEPELCSRSDAPTSDRQGTATANQQNQRKLNFILQLFPMQLETVSSTILEKIYHRTLFTRTNWTLKLLLLLISNQKKGRKLQMYLNLHLHLHWRGLRNRVLTLQDPGSQ